MLSNSSPIQFHIKVTKRLWPAIQWGRPAGAHSRTLMLCDPHSVLESTAHIGEHRLAPDPNSRSCQKHAPGHGVILMCPYLSLTNSATLLGKYVPRKQGLKGSGCSTWVLSRALEAVIGLAALLVVLPLWFLPLLKQMHAYVHCGISHM